MQLILATRIGLKIAEREHDGWRVVSEGLSRQHVTSVIAREGVILVGTTNGIFRSDDGGTSWFEASNGLTERHVRWMAFHPDISDCEFAGTEPAALFVSYDGGDEWQERLEVAELRDQFEWWLPYSPEAGCVRGFAFHGKCAYAAVEVGGLLRSDDGGASWSLAEGSNGRSQFTRPTAGNLHADVHSVAVHPSSADLVFAPTGGGFYVSQDGGASWDLRYPNCYVRAVWVDPTDPARMVLGPASNSSGENGRIEVSHDGGASWEKTVVSWIHNMVERFKPLNDSLFAVLANGELLQTPMPNRETNLATLKWQNILPDTPHINDVTTMF